MRRAGFCKGCSLVLLAGVLLVACASRGIQLREYVLTSLAGSVSGNPASQKLEIGVGPVTLPPYLRRKEIVTRVGPNELRISDASRWGEDLDLGLARVVTEDLAAELPGAQVRAFPWNERTPPDLRVSIDVERFEQTSEGAVVLEARWVLARSRDAERLAGDRVSIRERDVGSDPAGTVGAMSRAAAQLSRAIADAIRARAATATSS